MEIPLQVTCRNIPPSETLNARVREEVAKLEEFYDRIVGCHVLIDVPRRRHRTGRHFRVRVDVTVPGDVISVGRDPVEHSQHADPYIAIAEAFHSVRRRLQDHSRRLRQDVKQHKEQPHGRIIRIDQINGYGFLESSDGREVYFHKRSVLNKDFANLKIGTQVRFVEELGEKGPQASTLVIQ